MVIELVGLPGSGKSTLARELERQGAVLLPRSIKAYPWYWVAAGFLRASPVYLRQAARIRALNTKRLVQLAQLDVLARAVRRARTRSSGVIVLDQGALYRLSILGRHVDEYAGRNSAGFVGHWERLAREWAELLDEVVLLDADPHVLIERLQARSEAHVILSHCLKPDVYLRRAGARRDRVLGTVCKHPNACRVTRIDTGRISVERAVSKILNKANGCV